MIRRILLFASLSLFAAPVVAEGGTVPPQMSDAEISEAVARFACYEIHWSNWTTEELGRTAKAMVSRTGSVTVVWAERLWRLADAENWVDIFVATKDETGPVVLRYLPRDLSKAPLSPEGRHYSELYRTLDLRVAEISIPARCPARPGAQTDVKRRMVADIQKFITDDLTRWRELDPVPNRRTVHVALGDFNPGDSYAYAAIRETGDVILLRLVGEYDFETDSIANFHYLIGSINKPIEKQYFRAKIAQHPIALTIRLPERGPSPADRR